MSIYRAYDIRGIYGKDLTDEIAEKIGKAYGSTVEGTVAVGADVRLSGPALSKSLIKGLTSTGLKVIDIGTVPTPLLYFAIYKLNLDGGIMITGSHNPPEYNGFKMCRGGTMTLYGDEITAIGESVDAENFRVGVGSVETYNIEDEYLDFVCERIKIEGKPKIVLDCANGTAGAVAPKLFERLGCDVTAIFEEADGSFPNHPADPTVDKNLEDLIKYVKENGVDIGLSYDGDSDRAGFVDELGGIIRGDQALVLFSREILEKHPGASIIYEVKCSMALSEDITAHGGKPIMYRTGHSFIKKKIKAEHALMAGEMSGHFFFADNYPGYDDGIYASARMVQILSKTKLKLSEIVKSIPHYHSTPEILVEAAEDIKFSLVDAVKKRFEGSSDYKVITVDGVRVETDKSWGLIRASNTGPKIILRFEGKTEADLEEIKNVFREILDEIEQLAGKI